MVVTTALALAGCPAPPGELALQRALAAPPAQRASLFLEAAELGSLDAAVRLTELGCWSELAELDPTSGQLQPWKSIERQGLGGEAVLAVISGSRALRPGSTPEQVLNARDLLAAVSEEEPLLRDLLASLCDVEPRDEQRARQLREGLHVRLLAVAQTVRGDAPRDVALRLRAAELCEDDPGRAGELFAQVAAVASAGGDLLGRARALSGQARCLEARRRPQEALHVFETAARLAGESGATRERAAALLGQARCSFALGGRGRTRAAELFGQVAALGSSSGDRSSMAAALHGVGQCRRLSPAWTSAAPMFEQAARIRRELGDRRGELESTMSLAEVLEPRERVRFGSWKRAAQLYERAASLSRGLGDGRSRGQALRSLGRCLSYMEPASKNMPPAIAALEEAARVQEQTSDLRERADTLTWLGSCWSPSRNPQGSWDESAACWGEAARLFGQLGDRASRGRAAHEQGLALKPSVNSKGSWSLAAAAFETAAEAYLAERDRRRRAGALHELAHASTRADLQARPRAIELVQEAIRLHAEVGNKADESRSQRLLASLVRPDRNAGGSWAVARQCFQRAALLEGALGRRVDQASLLRELAWCTSPARDPELGSWERTVELYREAGQLSQAEGDVKGQGLAMQGVAWHLHPDRNPKGSWEEAIATYQEAQWLAERAAQTDDVGYCEFQQGWCSQPGHHPAGSWSRAAEHYARAVPLRAARPDQAYALYMWAGCLRRDVNPEGDWAEAASLYERGGDLLEQEARTAKAPGLLGQAAEYLLNAAVCAAEGLRSRAAEPRPRALVERAQKLLIEARRSE